MKTCPNCKKPYSNPTEYCTFTCHRLAIRKRVAEARAYPHMPGHAMKDRDVLARILGASL